MKQRTKEWYELRSRCIGASDSPIILGISPWKTSYQLAKEKLSGEQYIANAAMQRGIDLEPMARALYEFTTNTKLLNEESGEDLVRFHPDYPWMMASLDGISKDGKVVLEVKWNGKETHEKAKVGVIPDYYMVQMQHQLEVTKADRVDYMSCVSEEDHVIIPVLPDKELQDKILKAIKEWYELVIVQEKLPELSERDYVQNTTDRWKEAVTLIIDARKKVKLAEAQEKAAKDLLIELSNGHNTMGCGIKVTKSSRQGNINYALIPALFGIDLNPYRSPSTEYWKVN